MALMPSTDLTDDQKIALLALAREAIEHHFIHHSPIEIALHDMDPIFSENGASFVTIRDQQNELRGCTGTLEPYQTLAEDVAQHAVASAFRDHRFASVSHMEFQNCTIELSILTPAIEIDASSEEALIAQLRPNIDGLILKDGPRCATFLPKVWQQLPNKREFINHLKQKAGIDKSSWSHTFQCSRYRTIDFTEKEFLC